MLAPRNNIYILYTFSISIFVIFIAILSSGVFWTSDSESYDLYHIKNIYLWTRESQVVAEEISIHPKDSSSISRTSFSPFRTTYVITHGFLSSALYNWVITLKDVLLTHEDCNVIAVSWDSGSSHLSYYVVQSRVPDVGQEVTQILQHLSTFGGLRYDRVHLIGHSLGAHVSGFVGKALNGTIARITGLDPAGMGFNNAYEKDRLDKSDAEFVDVIHSHGCETIIQTYQCYGIADSIGHVDIWVNGGEHQSACGEGGDGDRVLEHGSPCSHSMSYVYYTESIGYSTSTTYYLARQCRSREHYNNDSCECPSYPQYMGFNSNKRTQGDFYLNTSSTWPYGVQDPSCPAASYTLLQTIGLVILSFLTLIATIILCVTMWLNHHPEDKEYFTTEFLCATLLILGTRLQCKYETIMNITEEDVKDD